MLSADECRAKAGHYATRGAEQGISLQRATILLAISRSWSTLANQTERYDAILKEERHK